MTPVQCCMKCDRAVKGAAFLCGYDNVLVGIHHKAGYCPLKCFGTDRAPGGWDDVPRGQQVDPNYAVETIQPDIPVEMLTDEERRGLGDVIKDGIHFLKLDVVMNRLRGAPDDAECSSCEARRKWLNRLASWTSSRQD